jgi:hypothetical protein
MRLYGRTAKLLTTGDISKSIDLVKWIQPE